MKKTGLFLLAIIFLAACTGKTKADLLIINAKIYTVDSLFSTAEAMAVKDGKILATGTLADLQHMYEAKETVEANGKFIYPGFIDAHAHFVGYGLDLQSADLIGTDSWEEVLERLTAFAATHPTGWIEGRGWDQNDWPVKEFPDNTKLNALFPDRPVMLRRVDGHAVIANDVAIKMAGITAGQKVTGGDVIVKNNKVTGVLIDKAIDLVARFIPPVDSVQFRRAIADAQKNCYAMGLTTITDCGLNYTEVDELLALEKSGDLKMRLYVMLHDSPENQDYLEKKGIIKTDRIHVRSFKVYGDGALGSRGACLLQPYSDQPGYSGFLLSQPEHFDSVASWIAARDFQMCTHAIGDSGNRMILNVYDKYLKGKNDRRWRVEHAQVVNKNDFDLFGKNNVIPSVQPTHATSDMYWAEDRLGAERVKGAYAFQQLLQQNGWLPLGTDFPVEDISPFKTFLAAVARKDAKGWPEGGYLMENALTREQTLRGMTIWAARSSFEEKEKGSLEAGKLADFIILDKDLMTVDAPDILNIKVLNTYVGGSKVH
ncbi:MAG: amidohydrolase [Chitinophagaceae bacterium]|nr:amidohydrolase [Chitinophagaceae bacterium]